MHRGRSETGKQVMQALGMQRVGMKRILFVAASTLASAVLIVVSVKYVPGAGPYVGVIGAIALIYVLDHSKIGRSA